MKNADLSTLIVGSRVCYTVPGRGKGNFSFGFGDVIQVNWKTVDIIDRKFPGEKKHRISKSLINEIIIFKKPIIESKPSIKKMRQLDLFINGK